MGTMYISQLYVQNVLGYSTVEAGAAILPAALAMVLVAPHSAKLIATYGSRVTLLSGYVFLVLAFVGMLLLWNEDTPYWQIAIPYIFIGIGVGFAGTPASNSLTGSVPVRRAGMASGTADLQRDLGGALMISILGAVLTSHYASAMADQSVSSQVSSATEAQMQQSFASAENIAAATSPAGRRRDHSRPRSRRSSTATSGRTSRASSPCSSARCSSSSCSRSASARTRSVPRTTPRTRTPPQGHSAPLGRCSLRVEEESLP